MKNIIIYISLLCLVAGLALHSCSDDYEVYNLDSDKDYVTFAIAKMNVPIDPFTTETSFVVPVSHLNKNISGTSATVEIKMSKADSTIFTLKTDVVNFTKGENVANIEIEFDRELLTAGITYPMTLTLMPNVKDEYPIAGIETNIHTADLSVYIDLNKLDYEAWGTGTWHIPLYGGGPYLCDFERCVVDNIIYVRAVEFFSEGATNLFILNTETNEVTFPAQLIQKNGHSAGDIWGDGFGTYEDNSFTMDIFYYIPDVGSFGYEKNILRLPDYYPPGTFD